MEQEGPASPAFGANGTNGSNFFSTITSAGGGFGGNGGTAPGNWWSRWIRWWRWWRSSSTIPAGNGNVPSTSPSQGNPEAQIWWKHEVPMVRQQVAVVLLLQVKVHLQD